MFAFSSPIAEPLLLLFFGFLFLVVATGVQMKLTRKDDASKGQGLDLIASETNSLSSSFQSRS